MKTRNDLRESQKTAIAHIEKHKKCALLLTMGGGKTATVFTFLADALAMGKIRRVLIIAPKRVCLEVWSKELSEWEHLQHLENTILNLVGTPRADYADKLKASNARIHIINIDNVTPLLDCLIKKKMFNYDCLIIDESSHFKDGQSIRFKGQSKPVINIETGKRQYKRVHVGIMDVANRFNYIVELTGTPAANNYLGLYSQVKLLDGGKRLGNSFFKFRQEYFTSDYMGFKWTLKPPAEKQIQDKIKDICLHISNENLGLPPTFTNDIYIELPLTARKAYTELKNELLTYIQGVELNPANAAVLRGKLQQIAQGFAYSEEKAIALHDAKLDALEEVLEEESGNVLCFYKFRADEQAIKNRFKFAVHINDKGAVEKWNQGKVRLLIGNPASCGHGLNLQHGGSVMVYYALESSAELVLQANARLNRPGQKNNVIIHRIIARNTVDDLSIIPVLEGRITAQDALLNALK